MICANTNLPMFINVPCECAPRRMPNINGEVQKMPMATKQQIIGSSAQMRSLREVMSLASGTAATDQFARHAAR